MSLDELIEQDMLLFLDAEEKSRETPLPPRLEDAALMQLNRDWPKDIAALLKRNNLDDAKQIFRQLTVRYKSTPADHSQERLNLYMIMQECWILLMNYLQDHHRTSALLLHMENNPEDVFNVAIRPIDLQHAQAPPREKLPEYQPITKDNIHQNRESELAKQQGIELPPPPQDSALRAAHAATVGSGAPLPATKDQQQAFVERARRTFAQALQLAKDSPLQARAMLDEVEEEMKKISLPERIVKTTNEKLLVLRHALDSYEKKQDFSKLFTASLKRIEALAPTAALLAREQLHNLREQVNAFEKEHHVYHGHFSLQLDDVQRKYNLFDEDEIVDAIKPMLLQIKQAMLQKNVDGFLAALDGLSHFTDTLPQSTERELLTGAIEVLRQKTQHTKATT